MKKHFNYLAPELLDGTGKPSIESDIYSLAFLIQTVYKLLKFKNIAILKNGLSRLAATRPSICEIKAALQAAL